MLVAPGMLSVIGEQVPPGGILQNLTGSTPVPTPSLTQAT